MDTVESAIAAVAKAWRAYGVGPVDRAALAEDLRLDLREAVADGRTPADLLGPDPAAFARRLADEAGVERTAPQNGRLLGTTLVGGMLGGVVAIGLLLAVFPLMIHSSDLPRWAHVPIQVAIGVYYGVPAAAVLVGAVTTVRVRLRDMPRIRPTVHAMTLLLPLASLVITPITMGFAWTTDYSTSPSVVGTEFALVAAALAGATVLARRWALRERPMTVAALA